MTVATSRAIAPFHLFPIPRFKIGPMYPNFTRYWRHPIHLSRLILHRIYLRLHPGEPWISQGAIRFCDQHLTGSESGLEWGSGRSTTWFGRRLHSLLSIEYNPEWQKRVAAEIRRSSLPNVECRYIALDHESSEGTRPHYDFTPAYVGVANKFPDESLDFVVVDGHYRQACILAVLSKLKSGGLLVVDNTDRLSDSEWGVPGDWSIAHRSRNIETETTIWQKP